MHENKFQTWSFSLISFFNPVGCVAVKCCASAMSKQSLEPSVGSTTYVGTRSLYFSMVNRKQSGFLDTSLQIRVLYSVVYLFFCRRNKWNWIRMHYTARKEITRSNSAAVSNPLYQKAWLSIQWKSQEYHHHPIGPKCSCGIRSVSIQTCHFYFGSISDGPCWSQGHLQCHSDYYFISDL